MEQVNPAYKRRYMVMQHGVLKYYKHEPTSAGFFSEDDEPTVSPSYMFLAIFVAPKNVAASAESF